MLMGSNVADGDSPNRQVVAEGQLHIRQHMPTQPGIIIPAVLFASWADKGRALVVMGGLCPTMTPGVKTSLGASVGLSLEE
ncbi:hypothetical protein DC31_02745 [Microbacterium sp. CH12i]|nr:hypothetical protein DC31_02745 [Microbacterium sp. CH12i]